MRLWNGVEIPKMMWNISTPDDFDAVQMQFVVERLAIDPQ